ncbi:MAG: hypothetical protein RL220_1212 [Bacteroidota bacterium]|jgi:hypothetical protein
MKKHIIAIALFASSCVAIAGNPDRAGSAGAGHLLINPWARSSGLAGSNMASANGLEGTFLNVAGLAFVKRTELSFTNTQYLAGTGIKLNTLGFGQKIGENSVLGLSVTTMRFGDIMITETDLPEGGIGSFSPSYSNIGLSFAKGFSNSIYGGITVRMISEAIYNVRSQGMSFDAGIRYVTGERDNLRFGIALRNVGPPMRYRGDGMTITAVIPTTGTSLTVEQRSEKYELPSLVNVGFAYDFLLSENMELTANLQYTSNSFTRDQYSVGGELGYKDRVFLRLGYQWEDGLTSEEDRSTVFTGPAAGLTFEIPSGENTRFGFDYSYRVTNPFDGVHALGVHVNL